MATNSFKNYFVFDLDDTLVDGREFCGETIAQVITTFEPSADFYQIVKIHEEIHGLAVTDLYTQTLKELGLEDKLADKMDTMLALDKKIQAEDIARLKIFDGVTDILDFLKSRNKKIYMCTNRLHSLLTLALKHNGILPYFDQVISCIDEGYKKPDPTCLLKLIKESSADKSEFIYFGDSVVDSLFAKNSGVDHIIFDQYLNNKNIFKKLVNMFLEEKINGENH